MTVPGKLRVHLLVQTPTGPLHSSPGVGSIPIGTKSRWCVACQPSITMGQLDRGTTEPWAVRCDACRATESFKAIDRPKPGREGSGVEMTGDGCCG